MHLFRYHNCFICIWNFTGCWSVRPCRLYWIMYGWCEEWKCYPPLPSVWTRLTTRDWHIGMFLSNKFIFTSMGTKWFNIWTHLSGPTWNRIHSTSTPHHPIPGPSLVTCASNDSQLWILEIKHILAPKAGSSQRPSSSLNQFSEKFRNPFCGAHHNNCLGSRWAVGSVCMLLICKRK